VTDTVPKLTPEQLDIFGQELDAIRQRVLDDRGERDLDYIRRMIRIQRGLEVTGRGLLFASCIPPAWLAGVTALSLSKILDNMEIGHNVMHGQYDWTGDPALSGHGFEWDTACPSDQWRHSHNYMHHTHTNIVGKDRDLGYGILRMSEEQSWNPYYLGNPVYAVLLAVFFEWGVAMHDLEVERLGSGDIAWDEKRDLLAGIWRKASRQVLKDYVLFPILAGPQAALVLVGNATANIVRNLWTCTIIFCGHFPAGVIEFTEEETAQGGTSASSWARPTSPAGSCSTSWPATSATRSSITCSPTSQRTATARSRSRSRSSARALASRTTRARWASSSAVW